MIGRIFNIKNLARYKRKKQFFQHSAQYVAKNILGDYLVLKNNKHKLIGKIVEVESYLGINDDASHSFAARITPRNKIMYTAGGVIYVYLIYGKYLCFNVVVSKKDDPQAVFIRALEPVEGIEAMKERRPINDTKKLTNGPCRWTQSFGIDKSFLGKSIHSNELFIAKAPDKGLSIVKTKRIGINYAVKSKDLPLRFYIKDNPFVSGK